MGVCEVIRISPSDLGRQTSSGVPFPTYKVHHTPKGKEMAKTIGSCRKMLYLSREGTIAQSVVKYVLCMPKAQMASPFE